MQKYLEVPKASKEMHRLDNEDFLRQASKKMGKRFESYKTTARHQLEVNLILNDIMAPELATAIRLEVDLLKSSVYDRLNSLTSAAAAVVPPPLALEEAAACGASIVAAGATDGGATCYGTIDGRERTIVCAAAAAARTRAAAGATTGAPDGTVAGATDGATVCNGATNGS
jgi:hypothetical protein